MTQGILLSGGMDSIALAFWKRPRIGITIDYGQAPAQAEISASRHISAVIGIDHVCIRVDLRELGSGDLAGSTPLALAPCPEWWPFRNQMLVTLAAMQAVSQGIDTLLIGTVASDGTHADGRVEFVRTLDKLLRLQEGAIALLAPAITLTSSELVASSGVPLDLLAWAHSCHTGNLACGTCRGCNKHRETWANLGHDPY